MGGIEKSYEEDFPEIPRGKGLKAFYENFLHDFRDYLAEYIRETVTELTISELVIRNEIQLFDGLTPAKVRIKNQGETPCYITTSAGGGYRLDPNEIVEFFSNYRVLATTLSGSTVLGILKS